MTDFTGFNDDSLFVLIKRDNAGAFTELYNRYWQKLYFLAHKKLKQSQAAEEIVQEIFLTIWEKRNSLLIDNVPVYLAAMTRYAVYAVLAKQRKSTAVPDKVSDDGSFNRLFEHLDHKLLLEIVSRLSAGLPEKCRLVFVKNKLYDQSLNTVAKDLKISPKTAETHLTKALKIIRKKMRDAFFLLLFFGN